LHPLVNHLIQLQEMNLIRDEQQAHKRADQLAQLDQSIETLTSELPAEVRVTYDRLHRKDHVVIVPVSNGVCAACGMRLPISLVQAVRSSNALQHCPTCFRMLFYPESAVRHIARAHRRTEERRVGVTRFSSGSLMIPRLVSTDMEGAIRELACRMEAEGFVDNADRLAEQALAREAICSTAVDPGLAFPHVRGVEGGGLTLSLGVSAKGIRFDEHVKSPARIIFFIVIPTAASAFYLKLIAGLAETFMDAEARKKLTAEEEPSKLWKTFVKLTRSTIP
jgi:mannitol/fructose-specific phosphotransferase system IIA component (Ntr-type)